MIFTENASLGSQATRLCLPPHVGSCQPEPGHRQLGGPQSLKKTPSLVISFENWMISWFFLFVCFYNLDYSISLEKLGARAIPLVGNK